MQTTKILFGVGESRINQPEGLRAELPVYKYYLLSLDKTKCTGNLHDAKTSTYTTKTHDKRRIRVRHPSVRGRTLSP